MIVMRNYPKLGSYIYVQNDTYSFAEVEDRHKPIQGVGGVSEDGQTVGAYVKDKKLFIFYNGKSFEAPIADLKCTNNFVSKFERCFHVSIQDNEICNIIYEPFVDPGMIYYDADPEEFDVLLYLSELLKNRDAMERFMIGMTRNIGK